MTDTDKTQISGKELVHLARLAMAGRDQDVLMLVRRLSRRYRDAMPQVADDLAQLLREAPTRQSPIRRDISTAVPVDTDSRLHLARVEHVTALDVDPIWQDEVARKLEQLVQERFRQDELAQQNLAPTRTVVFTGLPGVGKSLAARWLAWRMNRPLVILDLSAVMSSFLGRTGTNVRHVLDYAKSVDCILLLDELDAVAKRRDDNLEVGELKRLVTVLLQEIDDWPSSGLLVAATNHPDLLDPAIWRRFEMNIEFPMPENDAVTRAVSAFSGPNGEFPEHLRVVLSTLLAGVSFSDIEREINGMRRDAVIRGQTLEVSIQDLVRRRIEDLPRSERGKVASSLTRLGLSQRQAHDLTGVSRDTIRKATTQGRPRK